jgi:FSR family fosmidomycin resistance protein-like MFS transporter
VQTDGLIMPTTSDYPTTRPEMEAITTAQPEPFQTGRVLSMTLAHAMNDTYTSFLAPLLPAFIAKLALSKTEAGLLAFTQSSPSVLQPVIGHLADRLTLRYFVILAPAVTATMMSLLGVAPRYLVLALLVMLAGLSSASLHAVAPAMAGRLSGRSLGRGMGLWMVGGILGYTVGPIIVVAVVNLLGLEGTPWLMIGGWLASLILYIRLRDLPGRSPTQGETNSWRQGLQAMRPILGSVVGIMVARSLMVPATITFLPTFLTEEGANLWLAGASVSIVVGAGVVGSLLGGSMSDRFGRRLVLFISTATPPLLMFLFLGVTGWARPPILLFLGATMPVVQVVLMAVVQESCPENRALANGVFLSVTFIAEAGAAVVVGALGDLFGLHLAFATSAVIALLGLPLVLRVPGRQQKGVQL